MSQRVWVILETRATQRVRVSFCMCAIMKLTKYGKMCILVSILWDYSLIGMLNHTFHCLFRLCA